MFYKKLLPIIAPVSPGSVMLTSRPLRAIIILAQLASWLLLRLVMIFYVKKKLVMIEKKDLNSKHPIAIAANHQRAMDPFFILASMPLGCLIRLLPYRFFAKNSLYDHTLLRPFLLILGCFPAYQHTRLPYGLNAAEWFMQDGQTIFIFPEGKRMRRKLTNRKPRSGVVVLAANTSCQIIPAKIEWRGKQCSIVIGKPSHSANMSASQIMQTIYQLK